MIERKSLNNSKLFSKQFYEVAKKLIVDNRASITYIQKNFNIAYPKADSYIKELCNLGYIIKNDIFYHINISIKDFYLINQL